MSKTKYRTIERGDGKYIIEYKHPDREWTSWHPCSTFEEAKTAIDSWKALPDKTTRKVVWEDEE